MIFGTLVILSSLASAQCSTLAGKDGQTVEDCTNDLSRLWEKKTPELLALIRAEQPASGYAAKVLALQKRPEAFAALASCLKESPSADLRADCAAALGFLADPRAVEPLLTASTDSDPRVQAAAVDAGLSPLGRPGLEALFKIVETSGEPDLKVAAMNAVAGLVTPSMETEGNDPALLQAVDVFLQDERCARGFAKAVEVLKLLRPPETLPVLTRALHHLRALPKSQGDDLFQAIFDALDAHPVPAIHSVVRELLFERDFRHCRFPQRCREQLSDLLKQSQSFR